MHVVGLVTQWDENGSQKNIIELDDHKTYDDETTVALEHDYLNVQFIMMMPIIHLHNIYSSAPTALLFIARAICFGYIVIRVRFCCALFYFFKCNNNNN